MTTMIGGVMVLALSPSGCKALEELNTSAPTRTGGVTMSLSISRSDQMSYELFRVTRVGEIEYGGGMRAFNGSTGWTGTLTDDEIHQFLALLESSGWCEHKPVGEAESPTHCVIEVKCENGGSTWNVTGVPESVTAMRAFLDPIVRRRFDPELDRLPEATEKAPSG